MSSVGKNTHPVLQLLQINSLQACKSGLVIIEGFKAKHTILP